MTGGGARLAPLDGLRGIAVLAVIVYHATLFEPGTTAVGRAALTAARFGWSGVDLFFVLSGFLITGILLDARGAPNYYRAFYARRVLRIFPLYYASLVVLLLAYHVPLSEGAWYVAYVQNVRIWLHGWPGAPLTHFWSLAIEEQYYLVWPLLVALLPPRVLAGLCGLVLAAAPVARTLAFAGGFPDIGIYVLTPFRLDALLAGGLAAQLVRMPGLRRGIVGGASAAAAVAAALVAAFFARERDPIWATPSMLTIGFTVLAVFFAAAVLLAATLPEGSPFPRLLSFRPLRAIGTYSYGMYVFHWPVILVLREGGLRPGARLPGAIGWAVYLGVLLVVISGLALLSWRVLEAPCLALKERFRFRPVEAPGEAA